MVSRSGRTRKVIKPLTAHDMLNERYVRISRAQQYFCEMLGELLCGNREAVPESLTKKFLVRAIKDAGACIKVFRSCPEGKEAEYVVMTLDQIRQLAANVAA